MLGEYSKFIQIQDDGIIKVFVPEDVNNPFYGKCYRINIIQE